MKLKASKVHPAYAICKHCNNPHQLRGIGIDRWRNKFRVHCSDSCNINAMWWHTFRREKIDELELKEQVIVDTRQPATTMDDVIFSCDLDISFFKLPPHLGKLMYLKYIEHFSIAELERVFNVSRETIRKRVYRTKNLLMKNLI